MPLNPEEFTTLGEPASSTLLAKNELPNKSPYAQDVYNVYLRKWITPEWQGYNLYEIHSVEVERWLGTLKSLANGTRAKLRNILSAIYSHAIRWEFFDRNPIASVRQTAKRRFEPEALTIDELRALLSELEGIYRTMVYTAGATGCRVSEVAGLRWQDCCFEAGEIRLRPGCVRSHETEAEEEDSNASPRPHPGYDETQSTRVCESQIVSTEGFTPGVHPNKLCPNCAEIVR